jgi:hypothetical protein
MLHDAFGGGWSLVASPVFKTGVTRQSRVWWVRFPHSPAIAFAGLLFFGIPAQAQTLDSARAGVRSQPVASAAKDPGLVPPLSPRRAFLTSLLLPGYAQLKLQRPNAAALFGVAEILSIGMARKSALDLREARRGARDSVVLTWQTDPSTGRVLLDSVTGKPKPATFERNRYTPQRIAARRTHYEDWIAAILFNHLISGADAYVAANLWDFPVSVKGGVSARGSAQVLATLQW